MTKKIIFTLFLILTLTLYPIHISAEFYGTITAEIPNGIYLVNNGIYELPISINFFDRGGNVSGLPEDAKALLSININNEQSIIVTSNEIEVSDSGYKTTFGINTSEFEVGDTLDLNLSVSAGRVSNNSESLRTIILDKNIYHEIVIQSNDAVFNPNKNKSMRSIISPSFHDKDGRIIEPIVNFPFTAIINGNQINYSYANSQYFVRINSNDLSPYISNQVESFSPFTNIPHEHSFSGIAVDGTNEAESITIKNESYVLDLGDTYDIKAEIYPQNADNASELVWLSENPGIVSVENGLITAKSVGKSEVEVSLGGLSDTVIVSVINPVKSIYLSQSKIDIPARSQGQLLYRLAPEDATFDTAEWSTDDPFIADIDENGLITTFSTGETKIRLNIDDKEVICILNVVDEVIRLDTNLSNIRLVPSETQVLNITTFPENVEPFIQIVWSSSDENIATVKDGIITSHSEGYATITAEYNDVLLNYFIEVFNPESADIDDVFEITIDSNSVVNLNSLLPSTISPSDISWTIDDPSIATIDFSGRLSYLSGGKTTIRVNYGGNSRDISLISIGDIDEIGEVTENSIFINKGNMLISDTDSLDATINYESIEWNKELLKTIYLDSITDSNNVVQKSITIPANVFNHLADESSSVKAKTNNIVYSFNRSSIQDSSHDVVISEFINHDDSVPFFEDGGVSFNDVTLFGITPLYELKAINLSNEVSVEYYLTEEDKSVLKKYSSTVIAFVDDQGKVIEVSEAKKSEQVITFKAEPESKFVIIGINEENIKNAENDINAIEETESRKALVVLLPFLLILAFIAYLRLKHK